MHITSQHNLTNSHPARQSTAAGSVGILGWLDRTLVQWRERQADIEALKTMSERDLRDAGLTRFAVEHEISRPFWRG